MGGLRVRRGPRRRPRPREPVRVSTPMPDAGPVTMAARAARGPVNGNRRAPRARRARRLRSLPRRGLLAARAGARPLVADPVGLAAIHALEELLLALRELLP